MGDRRGAVGALLVAALFVAGCSKSEGPAPAAPPRAAAPPPAASPDGKALFEEKCKLCHELKRALDQSKSRADWALTVARMKDTNACPITGEQAGQIVDYLVQVRGPRPH